MTWLLFAALSALLVSFSSLIEKKVLLRHHSIEFSALLAFTNAIISLVGLFFADFSSFDIRFMWIIAVIAPISALAFLLVAKAMRHMDISEVSPLLGVTPLGVFLLAFLFLGERITMLQFGGVVMAIIGIYVLEAHGTERLADPLKAFVRSRYAGYVGLAILLYSFSALFDRIIVSRYGLDPLVYVMLIQICIGAYYLILFPLFGGQVKYLRHDIQQTGIWILLIAALTVGYRFFQLEAVSVAASVGLVMIVKRSSSFLTAILGGSFFHEGYLVRRTVAAIIIICGTVLIAL